MLAGLAFYKKFHHKEAWQGLKFRLKLNLIFLRCTHVYTMFSNVSLKFVESIIKRKEGVEFLKFFHKGGRFRFFP